jgi:hypothetical protein
MQAASIAKLELNQDSMSAFTSVMPTLQNDCLSPNLPAAFKLLGKEIGSGDAHPLAQELKSKVYAYFEYLWNPAGTELAY